MENNSIKRGWRDWKEDKSSSSKSKPSPNDKPEDRTGNPEYNTGNPSTELTNVQYFSQQGFESTKNTIKINKFTHKSLSKSSKPKKNFSKIIKHVRFEEAESNENEFDMCLRWGNEFVKEFDYKMNNEEADQCFNPYVKSKNRRLSYGLSVIMSKIAEDRIGEPTIGEDEWDINELMMRTITKRNVYKCKQSRDKEVIVLILDTSPSCSNMAKFYSEIGYLSSKLGCLEIYSAPNGVLSHKLDVGDGKYVEIFNPVDDIDAIRCGAHYMHNYFHNRVIIFFGDMDGIDKIGKASLNNEFHFFNKEYDYATKYSREHHLDYFSKLSGHYECRRQEDLIKITKKMR